MDGREIEGKLKITLEIIEAEIVSVIKRAEY